MTREQLASIAHVLLIAGHETTATMITVGMAPLLENPRHTDAVRNAHDPDTLANAVARPRAGRWPGPMNLDESAAPARGLRRGRGRDRSWWCSCWMSGRLPGFLELDLALVWNEEADWATAIEADSGYDLIEVSYLAADVVPAPAEGARFVAALQADGRPGRPDRVQLREIGDTDDRCLARYPHRHADA
ncbi:DUF6292 family protein [Amycolatopsis sp. NPDC059090]|uniref:DUF6292 family protein n=1 Tax=Amycolatopsis sp. NPDC059090 TaxID=3346723 RepID=UPI003671F2A7